MPDSDYLMRFGSGPSEAESVPTHLAISEAGAGLSWKAGRHFVKWDFEEKH